MEPAGRRAREEARLCKVLLRAEGRERVGEAVDHCLSGQPEQHVSSKLLRGTCVTLVGHASSAKIKKEKSKGCGQPDYKTVPGTRLGVYYGTFSLV